MTALLLGASGLVGDYLLDLLATDERCSRLITLGRRPLPQVVNKHEHHIIDFDQMGSSAGLFASDTVFCTLGTTMKQARSKEAFRHVDYDYPIRAAKIAYERGATQFIIVTALGANTNSRFFYNQVKGEVERDLKKIGFKSLSIFRPSLLTGDRKASRPGEKLTEFFLKLGTPILQGPLYKYRATPAMDLAEAMLRVAMRRPVGIQVYEADAIPELARAEQ